MDNRSQRQRRRDSIFRLDVEPTFQCAEASDADYQHTGKLARHHVSKNHCQRPQDRCSQAPFFKAVLF